MSDRWRWFDIALCQCGNAGGNAAIQRQQQRVGGSRDGVVQQSNAARDAGLELQIALALDGTQMLVDTLAITQPQCARQIGARGRQAMTQHELADEPQDLLLARAQGGQGIGYHTFVWYRFACGKTAAVCSALKCLPNNQLTDFGAC